MMSARQTIERAALDQLLEHAPVALLRVDAPAQLEQVLEATLARARLEDRIDGGPADALDRTEPEADHLARDALVDVITARASSSVPGFLGRARCGLGDRSRRDGEVGHRLVDVGP